MIGLKGDDLAEAAREAFAGLLDTHHNIARVRRLRSDPAAFDAATWRAIADAGWIGARVPEARGGAGLTATATAAILDLLGARLVPEPYVACALLPTLLVDGEPALLDGTRRMAVAWQERTGQVDPLADVAMRLDDARLTGDKRFVIGGVGADALLVTATGNDGVRLVLVDARSAGVVIRPVRQIDGSVAADISFEGAAIERDLGGADRLPSAIDEARVALAAQLIGLARAALRITIDYAGTRRQFGRAIGSFQTLQHRMVNFATHIRLAEVACDAALAALDAEQPDLATIARLAAAAKAGAAEAAVLVTQGAVQIHGAIGYTDEADIGLYLAAALRLAPWLGGADAMRARFLQLAEQADA